MSDLSDTFHSAQSRCEHTPISKSFGLVIVIISMGSAICIALLLSFAQDTRFSAFQHLVICPAFGQKTTVCTSINRKLSSFAVYTPPYLRRRAYQIFFLVCFFGLQGLLFVWYYWISFQLLFCSSAGHRIMFVTDKAKAVDSMISPSVFHVCYYRELRLVWSRDIFSHASNVLLCVQCSLLRRILEWMNYLRIRS